MPQEPHILDYEPVSRRPADGDSAQDPVEVWVPPARISDSNPAPITKVAPKAVSVPADLARRPMGIKRGHAISYAGLFFFTAWVYFRPYEIFPSLKWTASIAFWIALATLAVYIPTQLGLEGKISISVREIKLALVLLFAGLLSVPFASNRLMAWSAFVEFVKVLVIFIILVNVVRTEWRLKFLVWLILVVSCWMSIGAFNDYRLGRFNLPGARIEGVIGGLFDNPNDMALHLVTMIPITIAFFLTTKYVLGKLIYPLCVAVMVLGIVASFSRGGFIGLMCSIGFMVWRLARNYRPLYLGIALLVVTGFVALAPGDFRERIATTGDSSSIARQNDLKRSIFILLHHPLFGVGLNNYVLFSNTDHATHNAYTQVGSEAGVPAMIIYIMFLVAAIKPLRLIGADTKEHDPKSRFRYLAAGLEASLIGYMVSSFFASVAFLWYLYYVVGYAIVLRRLYEATEAKELAAQAPDPATAPTGSHVMDVSFT